MVNVYTAEKAVAGGALQYSSKINFPKESNFLEKISTTNPVKYSAETSHNDFAQAVYGNGPYSLVRPNNASDVLAVFIDYSA